MRGIQVDKREKFISIASSSGKDILTLQDIKDLCVENDIKLPQWYLKDMDYRAGRGLYKVPSNSANIVNMAPAQVIQMKKPEPVAPTGNRITNILLLTSKQKIWFQNSMQIMFLLVTLMICWQS